MARFLAYTAPERGHLYPIVPTLLELARRGHQVAVWSMSEELSTLRGLGLDGVPVDPVIEERQPDDWQARTPVGAVRRDVRAIAQRAEREIPDLRARPAAGLARRPHRPLVLVTCSSEFQNDGLLAEVALAAFAGRDITLAVTTAGVDPASLRTPPGSDAHVARFLPHTPVLARSACVVCHGGMGITQKALAAGVPVCAVPFGRDQFEVARRVQVAGAGTMLPASRLRPDRLRAATSVADDKTMPMGRPTRW